MEKSHQVIDSEKQKQAKEYQKKKIIFKLISAAIFLFYFLLLIFSDLSLIIRERISQISSVEWQIIALYILFILTIYDLISLPFEFYVSYTFEHKYNFSTQTVRGWVKDYLKSYILSLCFAIIIIEGIYWSIRNFPSIWNLIVAIFAMVFIILLSYLSPVLLEPIFFKFKKIDEDNELARRLLSLCKSVNTKVRGVYEINFSAKTTKANAYLSGLGNTLRIVIADNLLKNFTIDEAEVVFAHELGHRIHRDILRMIFLNSLTNFIGFYFVKIIFEKTVIFLGYRINDIANFPILVLLMSFFLFLFSLPTNFYSRMREKAADEFAIKITKKVDALITTMAKFTNRDLSDAYPHPLIEFIFYSHPSIGRRIKYALGYKKKEHELS